MTTTAKEILAKNEFAKWEALLVSQNIEGETLTILQLSGIPCNESWEFIEDKHSVRQWLVKANPRAILVSRLFVEGLTESEKIWQLTAKLDWYESVKPLDFVECRIK